MPQEGGPGRRRPHFVLVAQQSDHIADTSWGTGLFGAPQIFQPLQLSPRDPRSFGKIAMQLVAKGPIAREWSNPPNRSDPEKRVECAGARELL